MKCLLGALLLVPLLLGQSAGTETEWDLRKLLGALAAGAKKVKPILDQSNPQNWGDRAAAESYSPQWKTAQNEIQYLAGATDTFAKQPERLTLALDTYFRLLALETTLLSFNDGLRKRGNPAVAELLEATVRENSENRERLRQYIVELAQTKEQESQIMDKEAQRCRAVLSKQPPPSSRAKPR